MRRNEQGHDSPVFEAVSGLELSSNLKFYPSSGRGRLTHTAHIKASILCTHTHTHTNKHSDKEQCQYDLVGSTENQILCLTKSTICSYASPPCFSQVFADNCFCIKDLPNHSSTPCRNLGVLRGTQILLREEEAAGQAGDTLQVHVGLKCRIIWIQR